MIGIDDGEIAGAKLQEGMRDRSARAAGAELNHAPGSARALCRKLSAKPQQSVLWPTRSRRRAE